MRPATIALALVAATLATPAMPSRSAGIPAAIFTDPVQDKQHPARVEILHIPSGGVEINGVAYLPAGPGPHPTVVICHGWPGNEKNLDLAQAARRAGWNAITFNYRGSWGSPGKFRFAQNPEDATAVLAYLRDPANAAKLGVDPDKIAIVGHSMGGWVTAMVAGRDDRLLGAGLISAANMGVARNLDRAGLTTLAAENSETLAGTSPEMMADELIEGRIANNFLQAAPGLARKSLLVLSSDDGLAPQTDQLIAAVKAQGGKLISTAHVATDHSWSDRRIMLQAQVLTWLESLVRPGQAGHQSN